MRGTPTQGARTNTGFTDAASQSVADAARQSREQKKNAAKQARVIQNEDLDLEYFKTGQEGLDVGGPPESDAQPPSPSAVASAEAADQAAAPDKEDEEKKRKESAAAAALDSEIARLKAQITEAQGSVQLQRRELALDQDTIYSNPNYTDFQTGKGKLEAEQQAIDEKLQEIEEMKAEFAKLQERRGPREEAAPATGEAPPAPEQ